MAKVLPTTKTQVSGHRFMRRRVEHGLIFGDVRMIHDPLGSRRRATIFGLIAVAMIAGVMGLFAWMRPNPDPGDAPILRAADGTLYVRAGDALHPVTNLTSARLIAGAPADPERAGDEFLAAQTRGVPVGIPAAPSLFAPADSGPDAWSVCAAGARVVVRAGDAPAELAGDEAVLATADGREWVVTAAGRTQLPSANDPAGRLLRRALGIDASTPRWRPPAQVLNAITEQPPLALPPQPPRVLRTGDGWWILVGAAVQPVTALQGQLLADASIPPTPIEDADEADVAVYPDLDPPLDLRLPAVAPRWVDPGERAVCAGPEGGGSSAPLDGAAAGAVELPGDGAATHFAGLRAGAVAVDSGHGFHVVSAAGIRHPVPDEDTLAAVGAARTDEVRWAILSLLPGGAELTREAAVAPAY